MAFNFNHLGDRYRLFVDNNQQQGEELSIMPYSSFAVDHAQQEYRLLNTDYHASQDDLIKALSDKLGGDYILSAKTDDVVDDRIY
tara:strand:- start:4438 stop:4692 length:255 start_codon:yes stop_codon:yes gene_type:complete